MTQARIRVKRLATLLGSGTDQEAAAYAVEWTISRLQKELERWGTQPTPLLERLASVPELGSNDRPLPGLQPSRGLITSHPLFAALWAQPGPGTEKLGRNMQAALLLACSILNDEAPDRFFERLPAVRAAGLSVRRLCAGAVLPEELKLELTSAKSLAEILEAIEHSTESSLLGIDQVRLLGGIRALVKDAADARPPRHRRPGSSTGIRYVQSTGEVDDLTPRFEEFEQVTVASSGDVDEGAAAASEILGRRVVALASFYEVADSPLSPAQRVRQAKFRARAIAASAQGLLLSSDRLQLVDLEALALGIDAHLKGSWKLSEDLARGALAATASLLLGRTIERLVSVKVVLRLAQVPQTIGSPYIVVEEEVIVLPPPTLERAFLPNADEQKWYRPTIGRLVLSFPKGLSFSQLVLERVRGALGSEPFADSHWKNLADRFVTEVNRLKNSRITLQRIADFLSRQVVAADGDWADGALLAGSGSSNARLYYYAPTAAHLEQVWARVWKGVGLGLGAGVSVAAVAENGAPDFGFGSRGCATASAVTLMVTNLIEHCRKALRGRRDARRSYGVHNAVALYTCLMLLWHTGARAVDSPIELSLYDPYTGFLGISDKDKDDYFSSRVAWLPETPRRQIEAYLKHLEGLRAEFPGLAIPMAPDLFFLDERGCIVPMTQVNLKRFLPNSYPFRMHMQRHYLRTMLRRHGVRGQIVDALLGHGAHGQEPFATHSCLSPLRLRTEAGPALAKLSESAGWVQLNGLAA